MVLVVITEGNQEEGGLFISEYRVGTEKLKMLQEDPVLVNNKMKIIRRMVILRKYYQLNKILRKTRVCENYDCFIAFEFSMATLYI